MAPRKTQRALDLATEKGSSAWLTVLPSRIWVLTWIRGSSVMLLNYATTGQWKISPLHVLVGKTLWLNRGSNKAQDARLGIHARGFWERHRSAFFDVRVCHPDAASYRDLEPQQFIVSMRMRKSVSSQGEFWTSSMEHLHLWSSPQLTEWERSAWCIIAV